MTEEAKSNLEKELNEEDRNKRGEVGGDKDKGQSDDQSQNPRRKRFIEHESAGASSPTTGSGSVDPSDKTTSDTSN